MPWDQPSMLLLTLILKMPPKLKNYQPKVASDINAASEAITQICHTFAVDHSECGNKTPPMQYCPDNDADKVTKSN
jgi:hypothetical protein